MKIQPWRQCPYVKSLAVIIGMLLMLNVASQAQNAPRTIEDYPKFYTGLTTGSEIEGPDHKGRVCQVDLPVAEHIRNFGAPLDDLGLCVFASMGMCARWHNIRPLFDIIHQIQNGGGHPRKVAETLKRYAPDLEYIQAEGLKDIIPLLDKALSEGNPACVTFGFSQRYKLNGQLETIYHMVLLVHLDANEAVVLDNNFPGTYERMARDEFMRRLVHPDGKGWIYLFLTPGPPPIPHN